jgi:8-oxo-dGTP pyrophosphatase MutT (NUDIX family)
LRSILIEGHVLTQSTSIMSNGVTSIAALTLRASPLPWDYADRNCAAIEEHWRSVIASGASYFNGTVYLTRDIVCDDTGLSVQLSPVEFKAYLYWRDHGFPDVGMLDGFGSGLIRSADGAIVLVRQRPGNINSGLFYLPGGFIDPRDVSADGAIDICASVVREVQEETGLGSADLAFDPGFWVTRAGIQLSFAVGLRSSLDSDDVLAQIRLHIRDHPEGELEDALVVRAASDYVGLPMPPYARALLSTILPET